LFVNLCKKIRNAKVIFSWYNNPENLQNFSSTSNLPQTRDFLSSVLFWVLRVHLAVFFLEGRYVSVGFRAIGLRMKKQKLKSSFNIQHPTYKLVGVLILIQAITCFLKHSIKFAIENYYKYQISQRINASNPLNSSTSLINVIERKVPSLHQGQTMDGNKQTTSSFTSSKTPCQICMSGRINPSIASSCGHIFCWKCIQFWCTNVRPECPMCRAPTKAQDIIMLHNYT